MRRRLARRRDTFDRASPLPAGETELNHRTAPGTPASDLRGALFAISWQIALSLLLALPTKLLAVLSFPAIGALFLPIIVWFLLDSLYTYLRTQTLRHQVIWVVGMALAWALYGLLSYQLDPRQSYLLLFSVGVVTSAVVSHVIARQFAWWMTVNVRLGGEATRRWQGYWSYITRPVTPEGCPEIESYRVGFLALGAAHAAGFLALVLLERTRFATYAGLASVLVFALTTLVLWLAWSLCGTVPWVEPRKVLRVSWQGIVTWYRYNVHQTVAPGVFQFPTVLVRRTRYRYAAMLVPLFFLTLTMAQLEGRPFALVVSGKVEEVKAGAEGPETGDDLEEVRASLAPSERVWYDQLANLEQKEDYLRQVWGRRHRVAGDAGLVRWTTVTIGQGFLFFVGVTVVPVALFVLVFTTTTGRLLVAFHDALEAPGATEVGPDAWPWDHRVSRMLNSRNALEREHLYLGRSVHGDYPVLLHMKLLQQHAHILGDTGSRKTSVGIAPLLTQLIGRADASILVLDLKGDKGLFECARDEAERAGLPFRFFTNAPGRASHVFNPILQSHAHTLTVHQRTQAILQALSLEYGEGYGEGFFSAVNEIVLKEYLDHYKSIDSFRRLHELVRVSHAYQATGGEHADWKNARHLAILLDKLGSVHALNLTPEDLAERPTAWEQRIDVPSLLTSRQVVYFNLSSAIEPTTVSPIARLALFNLLTAAAQLEGKGNRVYVFVDEFQRIVTENVRLFLEQARSMRLHFILANQTLAQLRARNLDLVDTVESCTAFKQLFKATDLTTLERLEQASGEALYHENSWSLLGDVNFDTRADMNYADNEPRLFQARESIGPRLDRNTLIELSAASWLSLVRFTEGSGYTQYSGYLTPIIHEYHIPEHEYAERTGRPWPEPSDATVVPPPAAPSGAGPSAPKTAAAASATRRARSLIDRLDEFGAGPAGPPTPEAIDERDANEPA
jgi:hypothetical protein